jgi:hypothetical protein
MTKRLNIRKWFGNLESVRVLGEFEMFGYKFFIHRTSLIGVKGPRYKASEFSTGYGVEASVASTPALAERRA